MTNQKIAIIGGGIIGSTVAYYLATCEKWRDFDVTLFDDGTGQATKAAAGIISPWLSKRRNQRWYRLARMGADVVKQIALETRMDVSTYHQSGTIITRDSMERIDELIALAIERKQMAPLMGTIQKLSADTVNELIPMVTNHYPGVFVSGGAWIDGKRYRERLLRIAEQRNLHSKKQKVTLTKEKIKKYSKIIICTGAWMQKTLAPLQYNLNVRPQKGELITLRLKHPVAKSPMPVLMPEGERDFIPIDNQHIIIGATHENDQGFDLQPSSEVINDLLASAQRLMPTITTQNIEEVRIGTRAYTDDFAPFFGYLPNLDNVLIGGGLGSSGLTTGPMIAKLLAAEVIDPNYPDWDAYTKPIETYLN
ncbi:FAD-binding oxidoreductase [Nicoliella spurrieriana]|uniref:FAD-binding oxidoreductase n=2 Tax=Nicoliella spurrieriana TaxID=2925830 RepID=A0A976RTB3_9LACO|nr:FAD-dependent oxidoreductase [Nicoliella spurrieriana]UQS87513.1 FAD-binding oxidoreductase [Nicoliella spurrieriana]